MSHLFNQPLHLTLKQYRVVAIFSIMFIGWLMIDLIVWYKDVATKLQTEGVAGLFGFLTALLGAFVKSFNNITEKHAE